MAEGAPGAARHVRVGMLQVAVDPAESPEARVARVAAEVRIGVENHSLDLVVLPELWTTGAFDMDTSLAWAQPIDGEFVLTMRQLAETERVWLHAGSFMESLGGQHYNTSVVISPDGEIVGLYRKIHLFGFDTGEAAVVSGGDQVVVIETPLGHTGLATCYDLRFPELFRALVDKGAHSVLVASSWPTARLERWSVLAQARAIEDQFWVIGCNATGTHGGTEMGGGSIVVDPWGDVVAMGDHTQQWVIAELDAGWPERVRIDFPVLTDRVL